MILLPKINPIEETKKIITFLQQTLKKHGFKKIVVALSGGVDSATCLTLAVKALGRQNVIAVKLPVNKQNMKAADLVLEQLNIPSQNRLEINISPIIKLLKKILSKDSPLDKIRLGNLKARIRMMIQYDLAKKNKALVVGTENKSEYLLGYYTRFGDQAADISPLSHLYKTQVIQIAKYLKVAEKIILKSPTAGLWPGQTDEKELGFSYSQADLVLYLFCDKKLSEEQISAKKLEKYKQIINRVKKYRFKQQVPYCISSLKGASI